MRVKTRTLALLLLCAGCPEKPKEPAGPTVTPEHQKASEALRQRLPAGSLPQGQALENMQKGLEAVEQQQDRQMQRAEQLPQ